MSQTTVSLMFQLEESDVRDAPDGLFLERLETFMEKSLADIRAFAGRENRPFDEVCIPFTGTSTIIHLPFSQIRRYVAEWHSKFLFKPEDDRRHGSNQGLSRSFTTLTCILSDALCYD